MKIIISPAKSLEEARPLPAARKTQPQFFKEAVELNRQLARMKKSELAALMHISDKLAELNYLRYKDFDESNKTRRARPAVYLYAGDVYEGLDAYTIPENKLDQLQNTLRILTGMYGILKPFDLIQPYRLEMGVKLPAGGKKDLYAFWKEKITAALNKELKTDELFLNLASNEYFKAIDTQKLKTNIISPVFKDFKNGKLKVISFFAKKARGAMVRYIIDHDITDMEGVKSFDDMNYRYSEQYTEDKNHPVFVR